MNEKWPIRQRILTDIQVPVKLKQMYKYTREMSEVLPLKTITHVSNILKGSVHLI